MTEKRNYTLKRFGNKFATYEGEEAVCWYSLPKTAPITVYTFSPVECVYVSPLLDFGNVSSAKNLYRIGIYADGDIGGSITFGYATDKNHSAATVKRGGFDLSRLDLNSVSFSLPFGKPCERRVFERRFFSSLFYCISSDASDLRIRGFLAAYRNIN